MREAAMPISLPEPDRTQLAHSPLQLVVCQVRFEETLAVSDPKLILAIHQRLGGRAGHYKRIESVKGTRIELQVGPGGATFPPAEATQSGWRLVSDDAWTVSVMPDHVALETSKYTTWGGDFRPRLVELVDAATAEIKPATEQRLGLRYIDRITRPLVVEAAEWEPYVAPEFLGPILHPSLGPAVKTAQQQIILEFDGGVRCLLRNGFLADPNADGRLTYVLDFDVFRAELQPFDPEGIKETADRFNHLSLQLFQQATTPELRRALSDE
jgi:uncharacterized protein (TIGR04255 family)